MCVCDAVPIRSKWIRYILVALLFTILFAAIPMFLVLAVPLGCAGGFSTCCGENECCNGNCDGKAILAVPMAICGFNCGIVGSTCAIPAMLLIGPFFLCYGATVMFGEYYDNI